MKRGQISIQFNWIFIMIAGAVIITFFIMLIRNQTKSADYEMTADLLKNLETIVKSAELSTGTVKTINIPKSKIKFTCEEGLSMYELGNGVRKETPYDIMFTPKIIEGTNLISWTQTWELPFKIAQFQYITNDQIKYVVINDTGTKSEQLFKLLPEKISKELIEKTDDIIDVGYKEYRIIEFEDETHMGTKPENNVLLTINLSQGRTIYEYGKIKFNNNNNNEDEETYFVKVESLLGAIFSEDKDYYECVMNKSMKRAETLLKLNKNRVDYLNSQTNNIKCNALYGLTSHSLGNMITNLKLTESNVKELHSDSIKISIDNQNLMKTKDCPMIY